MSFSLNEIESTAKKATRGAGYPWGLAEEAAKATRWLCARELDGCGILLEALQRMDGAELGLHRPAPGGATWSAAGGAMCPLSAGAALADRAKFLISNSITLHLVCAPALVFPFAATASAILDQPITLHWSTGTASVTVDNLALAGALPGEEESLTVALGGAIEAASRAATRATPDPAVWAALGALAHRTYAPATEESRLKGAGAETPSGD